MHLPWFRRRPSYPKQVPTLVHVTHVKAGSTWLDHIWRQLFGPHVAPRNKSVAAEVNGDLSRYVFPPDRFYSAMFMTRDEFMKHPELNAAKRFVVIRDLRDTVVSLYFSLKVSHPVDDIVSEQRSLLNEMTCEEGLTHLVRGYLRKVVRIQLSWLAHDEIVLRYEDLLENDEQLLRELLIDRFQLAITASRVSEVVAANRFESVFKRRLGEEDVLSHGRQGAPGNWRRYFTPAVTDAFLENFGNVLHDRL